jgi:hypothetical protein
LGIASKENGVRFLALDFYDMRERNSPRILSAKFIGKRVVDGLTGAV